MNWTDEHDQIIIANRGTKSMSELAAMIGGGVSRSAIAGRINRLKLAALPKPEKKERKPRVRAPGKPRVARPPKPVKPYVPTITAEMDAIIPLEQRKTLMELEQHHCRWIVGDPATPEHFYCGGTAEGGSYCPGHAQRVFGFVSEGKSDQIRPPVREAA